MSESKLNLSEAVRLAKRKRVNEINDLKKSAPAVLKVAVKKQKNRKLLVK